MDNQTLELGFALTKLGFVAKIGLVATSLASAPMPLAAGAKALLPKMPILGSDVFSLTVTFHLKDSCKSVGTVHFDQRTKKYKKMNYL